MGIGVGLFIGVIEGIEDKYECRGVIEVFMKERRRKDFVGLVGIRIFLVLYELVGGGKYFDLGVVRK